MKRRLTRVRQQRRAAAVVELAICLPVVLLLVFASLEGANMLFLRQAVVQSTYEAAKAAARPDGSEAAARALAVQILQSRNIALNRITFSPDELEDVEKGETFSVTVSVVGDQKSITNLGPFNGLDIAATATLHKE